MFKAKTLIKFRSMWMAVAILWIVLFHSILSFNSNFVMAIKTIGYGGVDIFLFASGLGCYFSYSKVNNSYDFIVRRVHKIVPMYIIFMIFYVGNKLGTGITLKEIVGNFLSIGSLANLENQFNWYVSCMWLFYFFVPYIYGWITGRGYRYIRYFLIIALALLVSLLYTKYSGMIIIMSRAPVFIMGMCLGDYSKNKEEISIMAVIMSFCAMIVGFMGLFYFKINYDEYLWDYALYWYPFILIVPGLCLIISFFGHLMEKVGGVGKTITRIMNKLGENTFPVYLSHILIFEIYSKRFLNRHIVAETNFNTMIAILCIVPAKLILIQFERFVRKCRELLLIKNYNYGK